MTDLLPAIPTVGHPSSASDRWSSGPGSARPRLMTALLLLTWFVAPLSGEGFGAIKLVDVMLAVDFLVIVVGYRSGSDHSGTVYFPRLARRHMAAIVIMGAGLLVGAFRQEIGLGQALRTLQYPIFGALPIIVLLSVRPPERLRRQMTMAMIAGTMFSLGTAFFAGEIGRNGRSIGLTTHMNQLGMTAACALPLIITLWGGASRRARLVLLGAGAYCLLGVNLSGARSALLGVFAVVALLAVHWLRRYISLVPALVLLLLMIGLGALTIKPATSDTKSTSALQRLAGDPSSSGSDSSRVQLLDTGLNAISVGTVVIGGVYLTQDTHNIFLTLLVTGGILAVIGLLIAVVPWLYRAVAISVGAFRRRSSTEVYGFALAVTTFTVWINFNNAVWIRYFWCVLAMAVMAQLGADEGDEVMGQPQADAPGEPGR